MNEPLLNLFARFNEWLWSEDLTSVSRFERWVIFPVRMLVVVLRQLLGGQLNLRAMSLVYTTLLSTVPLLAVSFSVLKGFGVHNQLEPILANVLEPLGPRGAEITRSVIGFVENIKVGVLGSLGLVFLIYTVVSLTQKIESSFNYVWQVEHLRGLAQRFSSYLSVILIGPVLMFAAVGLTATISSHGLVQTLIHMEPIGRILVLAGKLIPYLLVIATFTFIYIFIPNTRVRLVPALVGGTVAGVLWQTSGWLFATFVATSPNYAAIYSGFAILVLLLIWLYLSWLILLLGSQVAFYVQYPHYLTREPVRLDLSARLQERLALQLMYMIAEHHCNDREPWTLEALVQYLGLPMQPVHKVLRLMEEGGFLARTCDDKTAYLPRRDIATIRVSELYDLARSAGENRLLTLEKLPGDACVESLLASVDRAAHGAMGDYTLKDLVNGKPLTRGD